MSEGAPETVTPAVGEESGVADVLSFMRAHEARHGAGPEATYYLSGADEGGQVELTEALYDILKRAAEALTQGQSVSIMALDQEITTQQAADLLGLSRPTVVKLVDDDQLPATVPGTTRRKLRLRDVLHYQEQLHERRSTFIAQSSTDYDDDVDPGEAAAALADVRAAR